MNVPKERKTFCKSKKCKKHTLHKVTQYKAGKASNFAQGKRRYDSKQQGYGGQTKPIFHKKVRLVVRDRVAHLISFRRKRPRKSCCDWSARYAKLRSNFASRGTCVQARPPLISIAGANTSSLERRRSQRHPHTKVGDHHSVDGISVAVLFSMARLFLTHCGGRSS